VLVKSRPLRMSDASSWASEVICLNAGVVGPTLGALGGSSGGMRVLAPRLLAADRPARLLITGSLAGS
jgi:uncharacterized membrane protein